MFILFMLSMRAFCVCSANNKNIDRSCMMRSFIRRNHSSNSFGCEQVLQLSVVCVF